MKRLLVLLLTAMMLAGCASQSTQSTQTNTTETTAASKEAETATSTQAVETTAAPRILNFVDAFQNPYEVEIRSDLRKHPYNWDDMLVAGQSRIYEDDTYSSRFGIDISKYQGDVDWDQIKDSGVEFVILRIGFRGYGQSGVLVEDDKFQSYYEGAKSAGLDVGVYFFSQAVTTEEAVEEADLVLELLAGKELELPVFFDEENILDTEARTDDVTAEQFTANAVAFCEVIENAGFEPGVYSNMLWEAFTLDLGQLSDITIWYADYEDIPQTPYDFTFWQYSEKGTVSGINGAVDLNIQMMKKN